MTRTTATEERRRDVRARVGKQLLWLVAFVVAIGGCSSCGSSDTPSQSTGEGRGPVAETEPEENPLCRTSSDAPELMPGITEQERTSEYWTRLLAERFELDEVLLDEDDIGAMNLAQNRHPEDGHAIRYDLNVPPDTSGVQGDVEERIAWMVGELREGVYVDARGDVFSDAFVAGLQQVADRRVQPVGVRGVLRDTVVRCAPAPDAMFKMPIDPSFDRNNCSMVRAGSLVWDFGTTESGMTLVLSRFTMGWIDADDSLGGLIPESDVRAFTDAPTRSVTRDAAVAWSGADGEVGQAELRTGALVALAQPEGGTDGPAVVYWPTSGGLGVVQVPHDVLADVPRFTRRAVIESAFSALGDPYGWGGHDGGVDCSRYTLDIASQFGIELPRYSGDQPAAATFWIPVDEVQDREQKQLIIDAAAERGVVLLRMNGHIMLYLGRNEQGEPRAIHSFSEYLVACPDGEVSAAGAGHTLIQPNRVDVSGLLLGDGTERTAFIDRISEIGVLGEAPGYALMGVATLRQAAPAQQPDDCEDSESASIFTSPRIAHDGEEMRIVFTGDEDPGPVEVLAIDPEGTRHVLEFERRGAPPYTLLAEVESPVAGRWRVLIGDGPRTIACEDVLVRRAPVPMRGASGPVWRVRNQWGPMWENLFAAFVEKLFSYPLEDDLTWSNLHDVLRNPEMNILHNYYSANEEEQLRLEPDCADLPYTLRAYFAWKLGLPFAYRPCTRGREGRPPMCNEPASNLQERRHEGNASSFTYFARAELMNTVHSGSGRTVPENDDTDMYPIPLTREALRPGVTYIDPDGHLLVVAGWVPQTLDQPGVMYAADAQPDKTVGRRRFWRGSFLFRPETDSVGAGFKGWRPVVYNAHDESVQPVGNAELRRSDRYVPWSSEQNDGTQDEFYDRVESLINPLPVRPETVQLSLIDALEESVSRRVNSVENGEAYMAESGYRTVEMPRGYHIFETAGAWENYSTPARDMRLLISIDTVVGFADVVRRNPARFGIAPDRVDERVAELVEYRDRVLAERTFEYTGSDGTTRTLRLLDVTQRIDAFEMAYNPNDCPEVRWAEPQNSPAMVTCSRRAPDVQRQRMAEYREWFERRRRPAR